MGENGKMVASEVTIGRAMEIFQGLNLRHFVDDAKILANNLQKYLDAGSLADEKKVVLFFKGDTYNCGSWIVNKRNPMTPPIPESQALDLMKKFPGKWEPVSTNKAPEVAPRIETEKEKEEKAEKAASAGSGRLRR